MAKREHAVSLGGSLIFQEAQDVRTELIHDLSLLFQDSCDQGYRFYIVCGGGKLARLYRDAARTLGVVDTKILDGLGVAASHINARLFNASLMSLGIDSSYERHPYHKKNVLISVTGGSGVGHTTDYVAVKLAILHGLKTVVNLTDVPGVHPQIKDALDRNQIIPQLTWDDFRTMKQESHSPGISTPFDPEAALLAQENQITALILNGSDLSNINNCFSNRQFRGTVITPRPIK